MRVIAKIGTSSVTDDAGRLRSDAIEAVAAEVAAVRADGHQVVLVSSGAVAAGLPALGLGGGDRPRDPRMLQAVASVGQVHLMERYGSVFGSRHDTVVGQLLVVPADFGARDKYLHARATLEAMLELGVVPIVNENDALADDELRFGDNDRIAALLSQALAADVLVLLTDQAGLLTADPRLDASASLIEDIAEVDREMEALAGGSGSNRGTGGMASKLAAAKMATWSGVRTVIAAAGRPGVLADAVAATPGVGTTVRARRGRLPARKVWIAFAVPSAGSITVDDGARAALLRDGSSLLPAGVVSVDGGFEADEAVEVLDTGGTPFAKGICRIAAEQLGEVAGRRSSQLPADVSPVAIHRDDLVVLPEG
ncbi:MAG: glutamate 5-kinase [Microthrixaceae bacterium]|nr:glutamate 5-kinase [Microthrixaceae bacterium]